MKLLFAGLAAITIGSLGPIATVAQSPNAPTPTPRAESAIPLPLLQAAPLVQAGSKLLGQQSYQIESAVELKVEVPNAPIVSNAKLKTIVAAPNKFNTEVGFLNEDDSDSAFQIVSDGKQVWIYDVAQNRYSIGEYKQFIESETGLAVGTISNFYLKTLNGVNNNKIAGRAIAKLPPNRLMRYFQRFANVDLQNMVIKTAEVDGKPYNLYEINAYDKSYQATVYVTPQQADIERVDVSGTKNGLKVMVRDTVVSQSAPDSLADDLFLFLPPEDAQQVEQIEIFPF